MFNLRILQLLLFILPFNSVHCQIQKGLDIDGAFAGDLSGISVSMPDSNTVAIGAPENDNSGTNAGHVRIFSWNGASWVQKGADINGEAANDRSGESISMPDSNTIAIGAVNNMDGGSLAGHVRVYRWNGLNWIQKGLDIDGEAANDLSGGWVSMPDSNTLAIGARLNDDGGTSAGHVRIYSWNGSSWQQKGADLDGEADFDQSGQALSMPDSNTVAIGAIGNDDGGSNAGHVRIYNWNGSSWQQKGVDINGEALEDGSGIAVSMPNANTVGIGAFSNDGNGADAGHVRIYEWNGSAWIQKGGDIDGEFTNDWSGQALSMPDENTVAIGAQYNDGNGSNSGHVRVFEWDGSAWQQKGVDIDGEAGNDLSGLAVSMSDNNVVAIGGYNNDGNGSNAGHVRIYRFCQNTSSNISVSACDSLQSPSGMFTWTSSGMYTDIIPNSAGCDSIINYDLTIDTVNTTLDFSLFPTLTSNATSATYQWLDCNDNLAPLAGETYQYFAPIVDGEYAVMVTQNGCTDTSNCEIVAFENLLESSQFITTIYPNPSTGVFNLRFTQEMSELTISISSPLGEELYHQKHNSLSEIQLVLTAKSGLYILSVTNSDGETQAFSIIKI